MEMLSSTILVVMAIFLCWEITERIHSGISVVLNPPTSLPGTQLPGYIVGNLLVVVLLCAGVLGIAERSVWLYSLASGSYLIGGFGDSVRYSRSRERWPGEQADDQESRLVSQRTTRARLFLYRLMFRYILPIFLGYFWFTIQG